MVSNFVSGLILLAERPIRVGDIISVKGEEGRVLRIHVRATEIETGDRSNVIIPNSELITQVVKNRTHTDTFARVTVPVGVAYGSDVAKVRDILLDIARQPSACDADAGADRIPDRLRRQRDQFRARLAGPQYRRRAGHQERYLLLDPRAVPGRGHRDAFPQRNIRIEGLEPDDPVDVAAPAPKKPKGR